MLNILDYHKKKNKSKLYKVAEPNKTKPGTKFKVTPFRKTLETKCSTKLLKIISTNFVFFYNKVSNFKKTLKLKPSPKFSKVTTHRQTLETKSSINYVFLQVISRKP